MKSASCIWNVCLNNLTVPVQTAICDGSLKRSQTKGSFYFVSFSCCLILILLLLFVDTCCTLSARMDPALLRERELFKKRALSTPAVEKRQAASDSGSHKKKKPKSDKEGSSGSKHSAGEGRKLKIIYFFKWLPDRWSEWLPRCVVIGFCMDGSLSYVVIVTPDSGTNPHCACKYP